MPLPAIAPYADKTARYAAIAIGASLPISAALDNVLLAVLFMAWLALVSTNHKYMIIKDNLLSRAALLLFMLLAVGVTYSIASWRESFFYLSKYIDLLFIPLFLYVFRDQATRRHALLALAASLACVLMLSFVVKAGWMPANPFMRGNPSSPTVFKLRLTHNIIMAFGAFLFVSLGLAAGTRRTRLIWFGLGVLAIVNITTMVQGATGYVILGALIMLFGAGRYGWKGTLYATATLTLLAGVLLLTQSKFQDRLSLIGSEVQQWRPDQPARVDSSVGQRLEFYHNTLAVIAKYPLLGAGTGGFPKAYAEQVRGTGKAETRNPHNEFLNIMAQIGIAGLTALVWLFWLQWRLAARLEDPLERALARALMLTMTIGCLFNSLLLDHTEGLFYAWLTGVLYGSLALASKNRDNQTNIPHALEGSASSQVQLLQK
jgi:O-antigen ligase